MEPIWYRSYPPGMLEGAGPAPASVPALLAGAVSRHAGRDAFRHGDRRLSYARLDLLSRRFSSFLRGTLGLDAGDRVALMCPNVLAFPVALFGVLRAGLVLVNVNPFYTGSELRHQLADSGARALVASEVSAAAVAAGLSGTAVQTMVRVGADTWLDDTTARPPEAAASGAVTSYRFEDCVRAPAGAGEPTPSADDLALLQYTGGTTGRPKGAMLTHGNLTASVRGFCAFLGPPDPERPEIVVTATPLYHILGLCVNCLSFVHRGGANLLIDDPRDLPGMVAAMQGQRFSVITGVNTLFNGLLSTPGFDGLDFSGLRLAMGGGTAIQEPVSRAWQRLTGAYIKEGYGMSETAGLTQIPVELEDYRSTIGLPYPDLDVSLRDEEGREVALGAPGEICVRGPTVMQGYWDPAATGGRGGPTSDHLTDDGYFPTGDVAVMAPDGYLRIVDRRKDVILVSGFNVYPSEVESVASRAPGVYECACVGVPDSRTGEAVKLFVVPAADGCVAEDAILDHCRQHLARYKVPKQVRLVDGLPKSPVGKILRRALRDQD